MEEERTPETDRPPSSPLTKLKRSESKELKKTERPKKPKQNNKKQQQKEEIRALEKEKEDLCKKVIDIEETLSLNVGGTVYTTTKSTLQKLRGTLLWSMFSGRYPLVKDSKGRYFIDRDGYIFRYLLNYLRCGHIGDLSRKELLELRPEAEFFGINSLLRVIDEKLKEHIKGKFAVLRYNENSNVNHLSWQGKTEPCKLTTIKNLYKCIDEVLTEVDNRGWELMQMSGDGGSEGGWMYVFRRKPTFDHSFKIKHPYNKEEDEMEQEKEGVVGLNGYNKAKSSPDCEDFRLDMQRKHSGSL